MQRSAGRWWWALAMGLGLALAVVGCRDESSGDEASVEERDGRSVQLYVEGQDDTTQPLVVTVGESVALMARFVDPEVHTAVPVMVQSRPRTTWDTEPPGAVRIEMGSGDDEPARATFTQQGEARLRAHFFGVSSEWLTFEVKPAD